MERYKNTNQDSGITHYQVSEDSITVKFKDGKSYVYTYFSAGKRIIEDMKKIAVIGQGLNSYINRYARKAYERKF